MVCDALVAGCWRSGTGSRLCVRDEGCCSTDRCQWCTVKQISDNEIYLLIKYIKSILWRVAKRLSYIQDARGLKVNLHLSIAPNCAGTAARYKREQHPLLPLPPSIDMSLQKVVHLFKPTSTKTTVCRPNTFSSTKILPTVYLWVSYVPQKVGEYFLSKVKFGGNACIVRVWQLSNTTKSAFLTDKLLQNVYSTSHCQHLFTLPHREAIHTGMHTSCEQPTSANYPEPYASTSHASTALLKMSILTLTSTCNHVIKTVPSLHVYWEL